MMTGFLALDQGFFVLVLGEILLCVMDLGLQSTSFEERKVLLPTRRSPFFSVRVDSFDQ